MVKNEGVVYTATGREYVDQALVSIRSLRRWNEDVGVAIFTDMPEAFAGVADHVTRISGGTTRAEQRMLPRLECLLESPFTRTLALDTDTIIMGPLETLFSVLDRVSVGICHGHQRARRFSAALREGKAEAGIPYSFGPVQGGVILYDDDRGRKFVSDVAELYRDKQYVDDQVSMREVLWNADYRFNILGPEYNIWQLSTLDEWSAGGFDQAWPVIFHTVTLKFILSSDEIDRLLLPLAAASVSARARALDVGATPPRPTGPSSMPLTSRARRGLGRWRARRRLMKRLQRTGRNL